MIPSPSEAVVTPTDLPKSVRNRCVIEVFFVAFLYCHIAFWFFGGGCRGFCHRTESDLFGFILACMIHVTSLLNRHHTVDLDIWPTRSIQYFPLRCQSNKYNSGLRSMYYISSNKSFWWCTHSFSSLNRRHYTFHAYFWAHHSYAEIQASWSYNDIERASCNCYSKFGNNKNSQGSKILWVCGVWQFENFVLSYTVLLRTGLLRCPENVVSNNSMSLTWFWYHFDIMYTV